MYIRLRDYFLLLLIVTLGYWVMLVYTLPNDMLDCWLPWRHFVSKSFHNGMVPLWNPFQQLGYPVYADLQGPLFSLENFITGTWFHTNLTTLQCILFAYIYVAAVGMYELGLYLFKHRHTAIAIGLAYALGGFFNHHLQHFFTIVSVALLPFTLLLVLKFLQDPKWKYLFALVLLFHLSFTTGNQTFNIINLHFLVVMFVRKTVLLFRVSRLEEGWRLVRQSLWLVVFTVMAVLPVLVAFWQSQPYVDRYDGLEYAYSLSNSMSLAAFRSFINPFISTQPVSYLGTDPSMAGYFIGFTTLVLSCAYFIFVRHRAKWLLLGLGVVFILLSLGDLTPFHYWAYRLDPLLRLFRFPAYYMFYVYLVLLLGAGYAMVHWQDNRLSTGKVTAVAVALIMITLGLAAFYGLEKGMVIHHLRAGEFFSAMRGWSLPVTYTFAAALALGTVLLTAGLYLWRRSKKTWIAVLVVEMVLACNLALFQTFLPQRAAVTDTFIASLPGSFVLPPNDIETNADLLPHLPPGTWRNYHAYFNVVSPEFFNSFYLRDIVDWEKGSSGNKTYLWKNRRDRSVKLKVFEPGRIVFETPPAKREQLVVNQLNFPYWKLYLNNRKADLSPGTVLHITAPEGTRQIKLVFENPVIMFCFWCALGFTALMVLLLLGFSLGKTAFLITAVWWVAICGRPLFFFAGEKSMAPVKFFQVRSPDTRVVVNKPKAVQQDTTGTYDARFELDALLYGLLTGKENKMVYIDSGNFDPPVIKKALEARFSRVSVTRQKNIKRYQARGKKTETGIFKNFNLDSGFNNGWNIPPAQVVFDSLQQRWYYLLNEQQVYGPGITLERFPAGKHCFFAVRSHQEPEVTTGDLALVLEILRGNESLVYMARPLKNKQAILVFSPRHLFKGDEQVKIYYWLNGRGSARINRQDLYVLSYD